MSFNTPQNPYSSPAQNPYPSRPGQTTKKRKAPYPVFCVVMFIMSLVFIVLRLLMVALAIVGVYVMAEQGQDFNRLQAIAEIGSGAAMVLFGLLCNSLMLARIRIGYAFGWLLVIAVLANIGSGLLAIGDVFGEFEPGSPRFVGAIVGASFVILIRLGILAAYVAAMLEFRKWYDKNHA